MKQTNQNGRSNNAKQQQNSSSGSLKGNRNVTPKVTPNSKPKHPIVTCNNRISSPLPQSTNNGTNKGGKTSPVRGATTTNNNTPIVWDISGYPVPISVLGDRAQIVKGINTLLSDIVANCKQLRKVIGTGPQSCLNPVYVMAISGTRMMVYNVMYIITGMEDADYDDFEYWCAPDQFLTEATYALYEHDTACLEGSCDEVIESLLQLSALSQTFLGKLQIGRTSFIGKLPTLGFFESLGLDFNI